MKIVFSPTAFKRDLLADAIAPGGTVFILDHDELLRRAEELAPEAIIITVDPGSGSILDKLKNTVPDTFVILTSNSFLTEEPTSLFNAGLIDYLLDDVPDNNDISDLQSAFWDHYFRQRKINQAENRTEYFLSRMKFLHGISLKILENKPLNLLLDEIMISGRSVLNAEKSSFMLYDPGDSMLHFHVLAEVEEALIKDQPLEIGTGIAGWVAKHRVAQLVDDCYSDKRFNPAYDKLSGFHTRNMVCAPIVKNNSLFGVLSVINKKDGDSFVVEDIQLIETLAGQCAVAIENALLLEEKVKSEALKQELEMAQKIQQRLLPTVLPSFSRLDLAARLIPAEEVGGDYYTIRKISEGLCLLMVADVSGKGIPAALLVSTVDATLQTMIQLGGTVSDPVTITQTINAVLCEVTTSEKFVTAWTGIIDTERNLLHSVNAGHNDPVIYRARTGEISRLKQGGIFLGVLPFSYTAETTSFESNDILVFFSDGVIEAMDTDLRIYSDQRLVDIVTKNSGLTAGNLVETIIEDVKLHAKNTKQSDDITLCVAKALL